MSNNNNFTVGQHWKRFLMIRSWCILILAVFLVGAAACRASNEVELATPTPFSTALFPINPVSNESITLALADLSANPELFYGSTLQLTGQYHKLPRQICDRDPHLSPVTWGLVEGGLIAFAGGLDSQLRALLNEGQMIVAEGNWVKWRGPVGCGKNAPVQDIWYLSVNRIVDPHPLARLAAAPLFTDGTPVPVATIDVVLPATEIPPEAGNATAVSPTVTEVVTSEPVLTVSSTATLELSTATAVAVAPTPTATIPLTGTIPIVTGTPTDSGTPLPGSTVTPTLTPNPLVTATTVNQNITIKGDAGIQSLNIGTLPNGRVDDWTFNISSSDVVSISVAPATTESIVLSVIAPNGQTVVDQQNNSSGGDVETITGLSVPIPGTYHIQVATTGQSITDYALIVLLSGSDMFSFRGRLEDNVIVTDQLAVNTDHFWFFSGNQGELISILVESTNSSTPTLKLSDPEGKRLTDFQPITAGKAVEIVNYPLPASGMFSLQVGELVVSNTGMTYKLGIKR